MTDMKNPLLRVPELLAEASRLQLAIDRVASFSPEEASDFNQHAEYSALTAWKVTATQVLRDVETLTQALRDAGMHVADSVRVKEVKECVEKICELEKSTAVKAEEWNVQHLAKSAALVEKQQAGQVRVPDGSDVQMKEGPTGAKEAEGEGPKHKDEGKYEKRFRKDRLSARRAYRDTLGLSRDAETDEPFIRSRACVRCIERREQCTGVIQFMCDGCTIAKRGCTTDPGPTEGGRPIRQRKSTQMAAETNAPENATRPRGRPRKTNAPENATRPRGRPRKRLSPNPATTKSREKRTELMEVDPMEVNTMEVDPMEDLDEMSRALFKIETGFTKLGEAYAMLGDSLVELGQAARRTF